MTDDTVPLRANGTALRVRWKDREDLADLQGRLVRLSVCMRQAHWYAFEFGDRGNRT